MSTTHKYTEKRKEKKRKKRRAKENKLCDEISTWGWGDKEKNILFIYNRIIFLYHNFLNKNQYCMLSLAAAINPHVHAHHAVHFAHWLSLFFTAGSS